MNLEEAVFKENKTLWEVLDAQNITNISTDVARVNEQLVTLGRTVDNNQVLTNDRITILDTKVDNNVTSITTLSSRVDSVVSQVAVLNIKLDNAIVDAENIVENIEPRFIAINNQLVSLSDSLRDVEDSANDALVISNRALEASGMNSTRITDLTGAVEVANTDASDAFMLAQETQFALDRLVANQYRLNLIRGTNEYFFAYKPSASNWSSRRITFNVTSNTIINSNVSYPCTVLENGVTTTRNLRIIAKHDSFALTGVVTYPMLLGPCDMLYQSDTGNGVSGYMTIL